MNAVVENARIREELLATPGARLCGLGGCQVIVQGGAEGMRLHRQYCHATESRLEV